MGSDIARSGQAHYRCVGIGAGPANLSLASLLHSHPETTNLFLDRKPAFSWHDSQQIPGTTLQVSMFKDLVSLADPTNPFSFLAYLHQKRRVYHFLNAQFSEVPRQEFRNYLDWASRRNDNVVFGEQVREVDFDDSGDGRYVVRTDRRLVTADNVVVGVGTQPWVPQHARPRLGQTHFHVSEFMEKAGDLGGKRVAVIGGGQSGAEAFLELISRPGGEQPGQVSWFSRRRNFLPLDDSPFTNDFYMPCHADHHYNLPSEARSAFNTEQLLSSDGVSEATLRQIYQQLYVLSFVAGPADLARLYPHREVTDVTGDAAGPWDLTVRHKEERGAVEHERADVVIWATGFRPAPMDFLAPIAHRLEREGDELRVDQDYAVYWDGPLDRRVFVQNAVREQRGLADPNLSLNAWRSRRIVDRLLGVRTEEQLPSFVAWSSKESAEQLRTV
ncbi:lysine N(6)-hydroxylase/L-ornithine N(5)-oxygenase family protein [Streptomyces sp. CRN 30]|uniref:lysine N(6)-hydroxylase/L-ornithine N(5)-oxygenase family protein n=1 Tax=Streptomyces sp. CRN 30 TaxID=3075613 RepID=UPI002A7FA7FC|nr:SidA/IucD/PvdA family monooxygenase [Streptomyces sp. CRN 30]